MKHIIIISITHNEGGILENTKIPGEFLTALLETTNLKTKLEPEPSYVLMPGVVGNRQ